ncbi:MAG: SCO family protein [Pseudomonadota bacterium]
MQAPGYGKLAFDAPAPGSYRLPALGPAADGHVLRSDGSPARLHELMGDRLTVLSFIYTRCPDPNGCPLATHVLKRLRREVSERDALAGKVRFLTLSFDPAWDTPQVMRTYAAQVAPEPQGEAGTPWFFLTSASREALTPILEAYDQTVIESVDEHGASLGSYSHILRVYLIDRRQRLRNIYNVGFLHPDILAADLLTLLSEEKG